MASTGFDEHDHGSCIHTAMKAAEAKCHADKLQFTPVRRRVLEILLQEHRALGAYDILDQLRTEGLGGQPPQVYRALDFLVSNGLAHKIERRNAFISCGHPDTSHAPAFLICRICDAVAEMNSDLSSSALQDAAKSTGFTIERAIVEAEGICPKCQDAAS